MKPTPWDWDFLIHRHLEGGLTAEQAGALNGRLAEEPALRRRLAALAFERVPLGVPAADLVGGGPAPLLKPQALLKPTAPRRPRRNAKRKKPRKQGGADHDVN